MGAYDTYQPFSQSYQYFQDAAKNAMPSPESLDRAAARLRSRTDTTSRANEQQLEDDYSKRGMTNSGQYDQRRMQNRAAMQGAYSSGLAQIEDDYTKNLQTGAQTLSNIGKNYSDLGLGTIKADQDQQQLGVNQEHETNYGHEVLAKSLNDFFTSMGAFGDRSSSNSTFNSNFDWLKNGLFNLFGLGPGDQNPNPGF